MKFSYELLKKYLPELESRQQVVEALNMHAFETESREGDTINVEVQTNRYADCASHVGIAQELAAILGMEKENIPNLVFRGDIDTGSGELASISVKDSELCPRYTASIFEGIEVKESPDWVKKVLIDCGLQPINNIVDAMNYVMLETGQPLHAFDLDKVAKSEIVVRRAKDEERIKTIDDNTFELDESTLVIADPEKPLAIAGIKGGKKAEVTKETDRILVESASFERANIYQTSRNIGLNTDASLRFSHELSLHLPQVGLNRVDEIMKDLMDVEPIEKFDTSPQEVNKQAAPFDVEKFNEFIGANLGKDEAFSYLESLGFKRDGNHVHVPPLRNDIDSREDLAEEVARLVGYDSLEPESPRVSITPPSLDESFAFREQIRDIMTSLGFDEVYNYSFLGSSGESRVAVKNPISEEKDHLRDTLLPLLVSNLEENSKFLEEIRIFEIGKVFSDAKKGVDEKNKIGFGVALSDGGAFFELKGVVDEFLNKIGLVEFIMPEADDFHGVEIESEDEVLGSVARVNESQAVAEIDFNILLRLVEGEISYEPLPKYPSVSRDVSFVLGSDIKIGNIIQEIQMSDLDLIRDVDLIDEYFGKDDSKQSVTLRIIFQSEEKTLKSEEVDNEMKEISNLLEDEFDADIR